MFSNLWAVTGFLAWADRNGYTPVVDFTTVSPMNYWVSEDKRDAWTEYFEPVSGLDLAQVLKAQDYLVYEDRPDDFPISEYSQDPNYRALFNNRIRLSAEMEHFVSQWREMLTQAGKSLGVHFRGTDMKVAKSHWAPPTTFQMTKLIDIALNRSHFDSIFVASEDEGNLENLRKRYGSLVVTTDSFRTRKKFKLSRMDSPVLQWRYLLGKQVIRDTWLLGACSGLVSGHSNVSEHAQVIADNGFEVNLQIRRPRVDIFGSHPRMIQVTNLLRDITVSRVRGPDFKIVDRSQQPGDLS